MSETKDKPKYLFFIEVRPTEDAEVVRCEWTGLTLLAAKTMYKATENNYSVQANLMLNERVWPAMSRVFLLD